MKSVKFGKLKSQQYAMKESLRALKTNIQFCGDDIKTIVVTSALPNEGKSTVTLDLARSLTESGKRVLLIDTDMRKSVYVGRLRAVSTDGSEIFGLSHFLSGQKKRQKALYRRNCGGFPPVRFCHCLSLRSLCLHVADALCAVGERRA